MATPTSLHLWASQPYWMGASEGPEEARVVLTLGMVSRPREWACRGLEVVVGPWLTPMALELLPIRMQDVLVLCSP